MTDKERQAIRLNMWANRAVGMSSSADQAARTAERLAKQDDNMPLSVSQDDLIWARRRASDLWHLSRATDDEVFGDADPDGEEPPPAGDHSGCDPLYGNRMDSADMREN